MTTQRFSVLRSVLLAGGISALLLSGQPSASAAAADPAPLQAHARSTALRIGTFNLDADVPLDTWRTAVGQFLPYTDIAGMQEVAGKAKKEVLEGLPGIGSYVPQHTQDPILWNDSLYSLVGGRSAPMAAGRRVEAPVGRGTIWQPTKKATVARLRNRATGQVLSVIDVHMLHQAVDKGKPVKGVPRRVRMYKDQVKGLDRIIATERSWSGGRVWVLGDFNDNYMADKELHRRALAYSHLHRHHLVASWETRGRIKPGRGTSTGNGSYLDAIYALQPAASVRVLRQSRFDIGQHYPLLSSYNVP
ncbi:MAG: hypothetical protein ACXVD1_00335 [Nocardioides sp.]